MGNEKDEVFISEAEGSIVFDPVTKFDQQERAAIEQFKGEGTAIEIAARNLQVVDELSRGQSSEMRESARQSIKTIDAKFEKARKRALETHREIVSLINEMAKPFENVMKVLDKKSSDYLTEQERIRREAQAKIDAETKRREDAERERLLKLAEKQMDNGKIDKAEATLQRADEVFMPAPILPGLDKSVKTESGGTSSMKDFDVVVVDALAVVQQIAAGRLPLTAVTINVNVLKNWAKMNRVGDKLPTIIGCRINEKFSFSGRAAK